jgi:tRNA pseudouridine38-40 synthase
VRVFSVQRVVKSWNARMECLRRTYSYYLPASALGLALDGGAADQERLGRLEAAWGAFQGNHPFHNFTKRRLYRKGAPSKRRRGVTGGGGGAGEESSGGEQDGTEAAESPLDSSSEQSSSLPQIEGQATLSSEEESAVDEDEAQEGSEAEQVSHRGRVQLTWKHERDAADPVVRRHYR